MVQVAADSDWFDLKSPEVAEAEKRWREALTASARYPAALWGQSVEQAVSYVVAFLVNPADAFCDFAFAGAEGDAHPKTIQQRLNILQAVSGATRSDESLLRATERRVHFQRGSEGGHSEG